MSNTLSQHTIDQMIKLAQQSPWCEQCEATGDVIDDFAGGNVDDAYNGGVYAGQTYLAREILDGLNIKWQE